MSRRDFNRPSDDLSCLLVFILVVVGAVLVLQWWLS